MWSGSCAREFATPRYALELPEEAGAVVAGVLFGVEGAASPFDAVAFSLPPEAPLALPDSLVPLPPASLLAAAAPSPPLAAGGFELNGRRSQGTLQRTLAKGTGG